MHKSKPAYDAIKNGDIDALRGFLDIDPTPVHAITPFGPLVHVAAGLGDKQMINLLLERGADIEARGGILGGTAINEAASDARGRAVRLLLCLGAQMDLSEPERNPLFSAIHSGSLEIVRLLVERGIDTTVAYTGESMKSMDASAFALEMGKTKIVHFLRTRLQEV